ncbi:myosin-like protein [Achlya hypogyna]|uniref:Myosin-like protein n=1 Tax=Achlya hypogyna TaxID=1202772 RepID=A0A1V9YBT3_ACHHY|nr:myosin-like protein [Achlya hypogyna]
MLRMTTELDILAARIVGHRTMVLLNHKEPFVEYQIEISTPKGLVICWKRYSEFRILRAGLQRTSKLRRSQLPALPPRRWLANLSTDTIRERTAQLNQFLTELVAEENLQWGIQIDSTLAVLKRRRPCTIDGSLLDSFRSTTLASPQWYSV